MPDKVEATREGNVREREHGTHGHEPERPADHGARHEDGAHHEHSPEMFRERFWVTLLLTLPVVYLSEHIQAIFGYRAPEFPGSDWLPALLATAIFVYGGRVFLDGAARELRARTPGMMTLIALAISVAFVFSWAVRIGLLDAEALWWELATLVTIMLLGHWIEMRSVDQARGALDELAKLLPDTATRLVDGREEEVRVDELAAGDLLLVRPGESIPADGVVRGGSSDVDESLVTGESRPVEKTEGDDVVAGAINGSGALRIEVVGAGDDTKLSGIMRLVADAQESKSRAQLLADRAARILTLVAIVSGVLTVLVWSLLGAPLDFAIVRSVAVLVIACPHALGLAIPLVVAISTALGARNGLLIRDRRGLEEARELDIVVFDKTGTLTLGEFRVVDTVTAEGVDDAEALRLAAGIEAQSEHSIAKGIVSSARDRKIEIPEVIDFKSIPGKGVAAEIEGRQYHIGGPALLESLAAVADDVIEKAALRAAERGQASVYLVRDTEVLAMIAVADAVREESRTAVRALHDRGMEVAMLTGDAQAVADAVAAELGIDSVMAQVLPEDKSAEIRALQAKGKRVAMVGDGVNDAPALATADVGIAIGTGADVAVEAGHIVLIRSDPRDIPRIVDLSRATYRKMVQNLWWAAGYNVVAIPLAAGVLYAWGVLLTPAFGAILMSASTVIVAVNAQLMRRAAI